MLSFILLIVLVCYRSCLHATSHFCFLVSLRALNDMGERLKEISKVRRNPRRVVQMVNGASLLFVGPLTRTCSRSRMPKPKK
jgi:hypothetical protein